MGASDGWIFLADALELSAVLLLRHELTVGAVAFGLLAEKTVLDLAALFDRSDAVSIAYGFVGRHDTSLLRAFPDSQTQRLYLPQPWILAGNKRRLAEKAARRRRRGAKRFAKTRSR